MSVLGDWPASNNSYAKLIHDLPAYDNLFSFDRPQVFHFDAGLQPRTTASGFPMFQDFLVRIEERAKRGRFAYVAQPPAHF
jgi:hypothetical protein